MISAVVFDVGETLLDDSREWGAWADWIGVSRHTFSTVLGAVTAAGRDNAETFAYFKPGFDVGWERILREQAGKGERFDEEDLYPDARPALARLKELDLWVGIAGNQTVRAAELLRELALPIDGIATSGEWGVAKPSPEFFRRVVAMTPGGTAESVLYVGDHRDNDIVPARTAGLCTAMVRRGPWGFLWADDPVVRANADWVIDSLMELPGVIASTAG
ncbi:HAD family hydrolase [Saccharothrix sp.]|uniref:HAD family hydrolase n=1 Tax=Saccharothrix sp. TaxID=1873460 RepID=UPI002810CA6D|nr:HAD family hydrolase [Saccharothrix sp.]